MSIKTVTLGKDKEMKDYIMSPIEKLALDLCYEIEKLPASDQQTKISIMASNLHIRIKDNNSGVK